MEGKKLNLSAPLLSVRRIPTPTQSSGETRKVTQNSLSTRRRNLQFHGSELNADQVTEPATVPFQWEQFPGRPKNDSGPQPWPLQEHPVSPRLPPGKSSNVVDRSVEREFEENSGSTSSRRQFEAFSLMESVYHSEAIKELIEDVDSNKDDDDDGDSYSDALEALSPRGSFSLNCSMSGLSGSSVRSMNVPESSSRDFMMKRFLPAAKAMTLESPQYASRKQPVAVEQPRQIVKVIGQDKPTTPRQYRANIIPQYTQEEAAEESEDEEDKFDYSGYINKRCRLFPRLCFRNSLCILNPVPGLKLKTQSIKSSDLESGRPEKPASMKFPSKYVTKNATTKDKPSSGRESPRLQMIKNKLIKGSKRLAFSGELQTRARVEEIRNKLLNGSKRLAFSGELRTRESFSPCRRSVSGSSSPKRSFFSINTKTKSSNEKESPKLPGTKSNSIIGSKRFAFSGELQSRSNFSPCTRSANSSPKRSFFSLNIKKSSSGRESPNQLESKNKPVSGSRRLAFSGELQARSSLSPYRRSVSGAVSPYRNVPSKSPYHGVGFRGDPKRIESCSISMLNIYDKQRKNFRDVSSYQRNESVSCSGSPAVDRTLYIDTVNNANSYPILSSSERKQQTTRFPVNFQASEGMGIEKADASEVPIQDVTRVKRVKGRVRVQPEVSGSVATNSVALIDASHSRCQDNTRKGGQLCQRLEQDPSGLKCSTRETGGILDAKKNQNSKEDISGSVNQSFEGASLPPLPKSPSESWLWRGLPSISSRNLFSNSFVSRNLPVKKPDSDASLTDTKWETIVKTTKLHDDHVRYSEELITHASHTRKT